MTVIDDKVVLPGTKLLYNNQPAVSLPKCKIQPTPTRTIDAMTHIQIPNPTEDIELKSCSNPYCKLKCPQEPLRIVTNVSFVKGEKLEYVWGTYCSVACIGQTIGIEYTKIENYRNKWISNTSCIEYTKYKLVQEGKMDKQDQIDILM